MGTPTYTPLANITLGSTTASVTFASINQTYRDLVLVVQARTTTDSNFFIQFNGDTGYTGGTWNYPFVSMTGNGSSATSNYSSTGSGMTGARMNFSAYLDATNWHTSKAEIMDYSATNKHKTVLTRSGDSTEATETIAARWANNAAITQIVLYPTNSFTTGTTVALYGIAA